MRFSLALLLFAACTSDARRAELDGSVPADVGVDANVLTPGSCVPESLPVDGLLADEVYIETSSVQCVSRVCMTFRFEGDPRRSREGCEASGGAPTECEGLPAASDIEARNFCTCRCRADEPGGAPLCDCGAGFVCSEATRLETGGAGIRGDYCIPEALAL